MFWNQNQSIYIFILILSILPVSSSECERSFSISTRLKTYLRATQGQARLEALALINIHYDMDIDPELIVEMFMSGSHRIWS